MKEKILEEAGHLYMQYGVRSVTMDDIANSLSVSKKTIYQYFKDKDEIVTQSIFALIERDKQEFRNISDEAENVIEEFHLVSLCVRRMVDEINPSLLFDLKKYHTRAWEIYLNYKEDFIFNMVFDNMEKGKKEGYFRKEVNPNILARLRVEEIEMSFDNKVFPRNKFDFTEIHVQLLKHFLYGIMTDTGIKLFESYESKTVDHEIS